MFYERKKELKLTYFVDIIFTEPQVQVQIFNYIANITMCNMTMCNMTMCNQGQV